MRCEKSITENKMQSQTADNSPVPPPGELSKHTRRRPIHSIM